ncbi:hypothetical protein N337_10839, partial [Phoenicopterus ruber ruber]
LLKERDLITEHKKKPTCDRSLASCALDPALCETYYPLTLKQKDLLMYKRQSHPSVLSASQMPRCNCKS